MKREDSISNLLLLLTAIIWGFAFVAQRVGMEYIGPFTFNAIRFAIGGLSLFPIIYYFKYRNKSQTSNTTPLTSNNWQKRYGGLILGSVLFIAASMQQVGLQYTTAGKSGFITGLYVVFVAILGLFFRQKTTLFLWIAVFLSTAGMYLLSVADLKTISIGDLITFFSAILWAVHVLLTGYLSPKMNAIKLAQYQFFVCSILSLVVALFIEDIIFSKILLASTPILYGGLLSVGIAYTLQVVVQKTAHPTSAAIILSLESLFAVIGGWLFLNETLSLNAMIGCGLMLSGMIVAQIKRN
ncbi:MAG: DMT family transporter [Bacteroidota bacterium]